MHTAGIGEPRAIGQPDAAAAVALAQTEQEQNHLEDGRTQAVSQPGVPAPRPDEAAEKGGERGGERQRVPTRLEHRLRRAAPAESRTPAATAKLSASVESSLPVRRDPVQRSSSAEAAVLERLILSLVQWVDEDKARAYADRPSDLLRAVAKHRHRTIPDAFANTLDPSLLADEAVLDEAAVLYGRLRQPTAPATASSRPTLSALRAGYIDALRADYAKRRSLDALFAPSPQLGQSTPYFDGFALRNAGGMSFDDLVGLEAAWSDPALASLTAPQRRALLADKFNEMVESTRFPIGSIPHSLATALLRIGRYRGAASVDSGDETSLVKAFVESEGVWNDGESYPYHPRLLFATHLARTSGMEVLSHQQLRLIYENQVGDPAIELELAGKGEPARWIDDYFSSPSSAHGARWNLAVPAQQTQALQGLFAALRDAADGEGGASAFARDLRAKGVLSPNRLVGADFEERAALTLAYANERLLAKYGSPPIFDRRQAAIASLRRHGANDDALFDARRYVIAGDNPNVTKQAFGDLVDEFLDRADWVGLNGAAMTLPPGVRLKPRDELQRAQEAFNASLPSTAWVVATAKERLRGRSKPVTPQTVQRAADEIAGELATETESHRALMRGIETWLNTVPVAGPIYNIEEGVRHRDAARAAFGLLFLGADLFDVSAGAGGRRSDAIHPVVPKLRRGVGRIDASSVNLIGHPEMIEMSVDPVHIAQRDAEVPADQRPLARQVRKGSSLRWSDYDLVHLDEEDRIVPVRREADHYVEVDWRTGHRLLDVPSIELDALTGKGRARRVETRGSGRAAAGDEVRERLTVEGVIRLMERANDTTLREFGELFADAFASPPPVGAHTSGLNAPAFYRKVYESSDTFRRIVNRHAQLDARARNATAAPWKRWEFVIGDMGPLGAPRKAYTDFEHKRIYLPDDARIESTLYMSAGGPRPMCPEQVYLGEMVRALTGVRDPAAGLDLTNRGAAVYLTDKILNEAGYDIAEQIMFRGQNAVPDMPPDQTVAYHAQAAARAAELENRYLDAIVDAERGAATAETLVDGMPLSARLTVARTKAVLEAIEGDDEVFLTLSDFETKFHQNFGFYVQDRTMTRALASDAMVVLDFYSRLYERSWTFRRMFDRMPVTDASRASPWKFVLEGDIEFDLLSPGSRESGVSETANKIYVVDDGQLYLSESGLREVEIERALAHQMIFALTGLRKLPPTQAIANRGAAVYLTDKILKEAGFNYPRQLVAALAGPEDTVAQARLRMRQTSAMRSAAREDQYLIST